MRLAGWMPAATTVRRGKQSGDVAPRPKGRCTETDGQYGNQVRREIGVAVFQSVTMAAPSASLTPGEVLGDRLMSETRILVDAALDDTQTKSVRQALAALGAAGAQPFETLTGEFETHPFQFAGPVQMAPAAGNVLYSLITHWSSVDHFGAWKTSASYRALQSLGDVSSELFVPMVETRAREHLRDDKLQRDWEWPLEDRR